MTSPSRASVSAQSKGTGNVYLGGTALSTTSWTDTQIVATVPPVGTATGQVPAGPQPLTITADNGKATVNGLTFHVLGGTGGSAYNPTVYEVGPGVATAAYDPTSPASQSAAGANHAVQNAIDDAASSNGSDLVVVYPNAATAGNPRGAYYENLVVSAPVKLQGVGAGGFQGPDNNSPYVPGTILDGGAFGGDTAVATDWFTKVGAMTWAGNQTVSDGSVIYLLATQNAFPTAGSFLPAIDGFDIRGGDQQGFPGNINDLTGQPTGLPPNIVTQGGAIFANAYVRRLQITNNVVENNGGGYGTIRVGTPDIAAPDTNQHNENVRIANNRIVQNAGTNLAGAIGLFAGSDGYEVSGNDICGNFSLEYGAGVSAYGLSPNGSIHHNRIVLNNSNDEGAGIMIAGQLPANPDDLSPGSGPVDIYANQIQGNLANDDGGGIRFLMAGNFPMNVYNNLIANNVSTHEGGGIGINDAPDVRIYNNTIMNNITTATAVTSNGTPAPAGVSTSQNSVQLQATLPGGAPTFSEPLLFNNILWDNRAGSRAGTTVTGIGLAGDTTALDHWDVGVADGTGRAGADLLGHPAERRDRAPVRDRRLELERRPAGHRGLGPVGVVRDLAAEPRVRRRQRRRGRAAAGPHGQLPPPGVRGWHRVFGVRPRRGEPRRCQRPGDGHRRRHPSLRCRLRRRVGRAHRQRDRAARGVPLLDRRQQASPRCVQAR